MRDDSTGASRSDGFSSAPSLRSFLAGLIKVGCKDCAEEMCREGTWKMGE